MKYITAALVVMALLGEQTRTNAIKINAGFTDDLIKSLTEDMAKDEQKEEQVIAQKETKKEVEKKVDTKKDAKKDTKKDAKKDVKAKKEEAEKDEIPMDQAAIKAYSSVIADAAEDSEPSQPVQYSAVVPDEEVKKAPQVLA